MPLLFQKELLEQEEHNLKLIPFIPIYSDFKTSYKSSMFYIKYSKLLNIEDLYNFLKKDILNKYNIDILEIKYNFKNTIILLKLQDIITVYESFYYIFIYLNIKPKIYILNDKNLFELLLYIFTNNSTKEKNIKNQLIIIDSFMASIIYTIKKYHYELSNLENIIKILFSDNNKLKDKNLLLSKDSDKKIHLASINEISNNIYELKTYKIKIISKINKKQKDFSRYLKEREKLLSL